MPIVRHSKTSPKFVEPDESVQLARYIDITKFLSLIKDEKLFFCRIDKLEDKFEGTLPKISRKEFEYTYRLLNNSGFFKKTMSESDIEEEINRDYKFRERLKTLNCINCWNQFNGESYALWKIYSNLNQGIMIKSSFKRIIKAFEGSEEKIYCSKVKYIDYEKDSIDIGNTLTPMIHKNNAYSYEEEVRLIYEVPHDGWNYNWEEEEYENGKKISVNLNHLIDEIVISPFSPNWFKELIMDILNKYSLDCKLIDSKLK